MRLAIILVMLTACMKPSDGEKAFVECREKYVQLKNFCRSVKNKGERCERDLDFEKSRGQVDENPTPESDIIGE